MSDLKEIWTWIAQNMPTILSLIGILSGGAALFRQVAKDKTDLLVVYEGMVRRTAQDVIDQAARVSQMEDTIAELKCIIATHKEQINELMADKLQLENAKRIQDQSIVELKATISDLKDQVKTLTDDNTKLEISKALQDQLIVDLTKENTALKDRVEKLEALENQNEKNIQVLDDKSSGDGK